jgi:dienelactone hydrolase
MKNCARALLMLSIYLAFGVHTATTTADDGIGLPDVRRSLVAFDAFGVSDPWSIAGELRIPQIEQKNFPAVIIVHGSNGVDTRGEYHAKSLNDKGIITLEIDMWAARKNFSGAGQRPKGVPETLPDAYGALAYLASLPFIDADRIGIMGFSWGGIVTMLTATKPYHDKMAPPDLGFAAHVAFYPICWGYNKLPGYEFRELTGAPVLILAGELDNYDAPTSATDLVASLPDAAKKVVSSHVYPNATHGWNMQGNVDATINDPFAHRGRGGEVCFVSNPEIAQQSRNRTDEFFRQAFGIKD